MAWIVPLVVACQTSAPATVPAPPPAAAPVAAPAELLASVSLGAADTVGSLREFTNAIRPGAGAALTDELLRGGIEQLVGPGSLAGLDSKTWTIVIAKVGAKPSFALLGKITDRAAIAADRAMIDGGWAVVSARPVLDKIGRYALTQLAAQPVPAAPTATLSVPHLLASYPREVAQIGEQMRVGLAQASTPAMRQMMTAYIEGLASIGQELDAVVVTFDATAAASTLDVALRPRSGTRFAAFIAAQRASDYALIDRLPAALPSAKGTSLFAGHLEAGPYRDGFVAVMSAMIAPDAKPEVLAAMKAFGGLMTGDIAATFAAAGTGMAFTQLYALSDPRAAEQSLVTLLHQFEGGQPLGDPSMNVRIQASTASSVHDGVTLHSYDTVFDLSKMPELQRQMTERMTPGGTQRTYLATFDRLGVLVAGPGGLPEVKRSIDAARGKAPRFVAAGLLAQQVAGSKARKDSLLVLMDLAGFAATLTGGSVASSDPIAIALGFPDHAAHLRMAVTATAVRGLMQLAGPK